MSNGTDDKKAGSAPRDPMVPPPLPPEAQVQNAPDVPPVVLREPGSSLPDVLRARATAEESASHETKPSAAVQLAPPPLPTPDPAAEWRGIIGQGEEILWQGHGRVNPLDLATPRDARRGGLKGPIIMIVFALFWMGIASRGGGIIWLFGLIFLYKGGRNLLAALKPAPSNAASEAVRRSPASRYLLTNRAAYILRGAHEAERIAITPRMRMTLQEGRTPSVFFAVSNGGAQRGFLKSERPYGFENIDDAAEVYQLMRDLAREMR